jgi:hypothetical protein
MCYWCVICVPDIAEEFLVLLQGSEGRTEERWMHTDHVLRLNGGKVPICN